MDVLRGNLQAADHLHLNIITALGLRLCCLHRGWLWACRGRHSSLCVAYGGSVRIVHRVHRLSLYVRSLLRCNLGWRRARLLEAAIRLVDELLICRFGSLLLHYEGGERVEHILVEVDLAAIEELGAVDAERFIKLIIFLFHLEEAFATHIIVCSLDRRYTTSKDW